MIETVLVSIVIPTLSYFVGQWIGADKKRRAHAERALALVGESIAAAEAIGLGRKLAGSQKYVEAVRLFSDGVTAELGRTPTSKEISVLRAAAERRAWIAKLPAERRLALGAP